MTGASTDERRSSHSPAAARESRGAGRLWAAYAVVYDRIWDSPLTRQLAAGMLEHSSAGGDVVDLGCGTGLIAQAYRDSGHAVTGVDSSAAMLRRAVAKGRVAVPVLAQAEDSGLPAESASTILLSNVLHLHPDPHGLLEEALRVAEPGGRVIATWPTAGATHEQLIKADLASGRSIATTALAHLLRRAISIAALVLLRPRQRPRALSEIVDRLAETADEGITTTVWTVAGCQQVALIQRSGTTPAEGRAA